MNFAVTSNIELYMSQFVTFLCSIFFVLSS